MTALTGILFILAIAVLLLITLPFAMMFAKMEGIWENVKFWFIVLAVWVGVWFALGIKT